MTTTSLLWLTRLILAHLITDFMLQKSHWITERETKHYRAPTLYLHGLITAAGALLFIGWQYWPIAIFILITHIAIDIWKSYRPKTVAYFLLDQCLHLIVMLLSWIITFSNAPAIVQSVQSFVAKPKLWILLTGFVFITTPAGILIGQLTTKWREKIDNPEGLANAGKWIGIVERVILLVFILQQQYAAIGILIAAKGIIRFSEKDRQEVKTEYLVIGTLMSIVIALFTGLAMSYLLTRLKS
jgi:Protein of unknown function (DUF3307)